MFLFATRIESTALHAPIAVQGLAARCAWLPRLGLLVAVTGLLSACSAPAEPLVRIVGSSTVYPFTTAVVEQFKRDYPAFAAPIVEATGTGGGIKLFCSGSGERYPDIANASRQILPGELQDCDDHGVKAVVEVQIGLDGLVIAQSRTGSMPGLTERDVYTALAAEPFGRGPNRARTWADVRADLPAQRIEVIGPPPTSGSRDSFNALYMTRGCLTDPAMQALQATDPVRSKLVCSRIREDGAFIDGGENDNLMVHKVAANPAVLGLFGFSFLEQNRDKIRDIPLSGVDATYANIASFRYPASRPMFLYVKGDRARANAAMRAFLAEYTREATWGANGYLARRGMVPSPAPVRAHNAAIVAALVPLDRASL